LGSVTLVDVPVKNENTLALVPSHLGSNRHIIEVAKATWEVVMGMVPRGADETIARTLVLHAVFHSSEACVNRNLRSLICLVVLVIVFWTDQVAGLAIFKQF
jgi:predicted class III extradiol MEMO1 family dioxygenase